MSPDSTPESVVTTANFWRWAFGVTLTLIITFGSWTVNRVDGRIKVLEDARLPHARAEATLQAEVIALTGEVRRLDSTMQLLTAQIAEMNRRQQTPVPSPFGAR